MNVEYFNKHKKVTPDEGFVFTTYKEGDDILTYVNAKAIYAPLNDSLEQWREITVEEDEKYTIQLEEAVKMKELEDKMN